MIWKHASKEHPCPVCGKPDWCTFGDRAMLCQRVSSANPHSAGGWYHFYGDIGFRDFVPQTVKKEVKNIPPATLASLMAAWKDETDSSHLSSCARRLGVNMAALITYGIAWCREKNAWAFPMHDEAGQVIGIRLRSNNSFKWAYPGSQSGIFVPDYDIEREWQSRAYVVEGPTSCTAAWSMGLFAIGRASCSHGVDIVKRWLHDHSIYNVVLVADNDDMKQYGGKMARPGLAAAQRFQDELKMTSCIYIPPSPCKDMRDLFKAGYTKEAVEAEVNNKVWRKR